MSEVDREIEEASHLPLIDAAYALWKRKWHLDQLERPTAPLINVPDLSKPGLFERVVRTALGRITREREAAQDGPTFDRLRRAHPKVSVRELRRAIRHAVKLDQDCTRYFSYKSPDYLNDVTAAIDRARHDNPGFQEATYKRAWRDLATAMR